MPEVFLGELSQVKLFEVLKPLFVGKKDGRLLIRGKYNGEIHLENGKIVHAKAGEASGEGAFDIIMGWKTGRCLFQSDELPEDRTISISTEQLLLNWSYKKQEWEKIRKVIPSTNTIFRLSLQSNSGDKTIKGEQWNVLALANGARTIAEISESLGWDEFKTSKAVLQLVEAGLLEKVEGPRPPGKKGVGENFFVTLEFELKKVMGPVAPFVIEDKLEEFEETKETLVRDQAESFVKSLGEEIPQEQKRKEFLRSVDRILFFEK